MNRKPLDTSEVRRCRDARNLWAKMIDVWLTAILAGFLVIRVLDSHTGQLLLHRVIGSLAP